MKTRSGFVSNSSSSSFVILANNGTFETVADIALYMIPKRGWEDDENVAYNIHKQIELGMDPNHPISFRSCNYDTFICRQINDEFYIATCNNHDWDFEHGVGMAQDDAVEHYILYEMPYLFKYYNASYGVTGWRYAQKDRDGFHSHEWCKDCVTDLWVCERGAPFCPQCGKKPYEVDPFEVWWKTNKTDIASVAMENIVKNVARKAYEAGTKHGIEEG